MSTVSELGLWTQPALQQVESGAGQSPAKDVGKNEFLKLLIAQLQNQDPLNPVENQQFIAQLATFSSLEQLISINQNVAKLANAFDKAGSEAAAA